MIKLLKNHFSRIIPPRYYADVCTQKDPSYYEYEKYKIKL